MATLHPIAPEPRRVSMRLPRPLWFGAATAVMAIGAVVLHVAHPIYRRQTAVRAIRALGGQVETVASGPEWLRQRIGDERMEIFDKEVALYVDGKFTDADAANISALPALEKVTLLNTQVTDEGLRYLRPLAKLSDLKLYGTPISGSGLAHIGGIKTMTHLGLSNTGVTDAGLEAMQSLTMLDDLELDSTKVTDEGMRSLVALPQLRHLSLQETTVGDVGLEYLRWLTNLEWLDVRWTKVSTQGIAEFQRHVPGATVATEKSRRGARVSDYSR